MWGRSSLPHSHRAPVDVDPNEAKLLIGLIETLVDDWYVTRHERQLRMEKLVDAVTDKFQKPEPPAGT